MHMMVTIIAEVTIETANDGENSSLREKHSLRIDDGEYEVSYAPSMCKG